MKHRAIWSFTIIIQILLCLPIIGFGAASDPSRIVGDILTAYGGKENIGAIKSVVATGMIKDFVAGGEGFYARYYQEPQKLRIEIMPEQDGEVRILNGYKGWEKGPGGVSEVSKIMHQSMVYQYSYLDLPMGLEHRIYTIKSGGIQRLGTRHMYLLLISLKNAPQLHVYVDSRTSLITKVAADFATGMMGGSELATEYYDFRRVAGVLFPHRLVNYAGGTKLSEIILTEIRVNQHINESLFLP